MSMCFAKNTDCYPQFRVAAIFLCCLIVSYPMARSFGRIRIWPRAAIGMTRQLTCLAAGKVCVVFVVYAYDIDGLIQGGYEIIYGVYGGGQFGDAAYGFKE